MFKILKNHALSHAENRFKICLLCSKKTKLMIKIELVLKEKLNHFINVNYNDDCLPCVICTTCKRKLYTYFSNNDPEKTQNFIVSDLNTFLQTKNKNLIKRNMIKCKCYLCKLARTPKTGNFSKRTILPPKIKKIKNIKKRNKEKICSKWLSVTNNGNPHKCNLSARIENLSKRINNTLKKSEKQQLISKMLKNEYLTSGTNTITEIPLSQLHGPKLNIIVGKKRVKDKNLINTIKVSDVRKIRTRYNLSIQTTRGIVKSFRVATKNRRLTERGLEKNLSDHNHILDEFFEIKQFSFVNIKSNTENLDSKSAIFCNDITEFIKFITLQRNLSDYHLKFGIDSGGGFFKVCLSI